MLERAWQTRFTPVMAVLFVCSVVGLCVVSKGQDGGAQFSRLPASVSAVKSLASGEAAGYGREEAARLQVYRSEATSDAEVDALTAKPLLLYEADVTGDADNWVNKAVAAYYGKARVQVKKQQDGKAQS